MKSNFGLAQLRIVFPVIIFLILGLPVLVSGQDKPTPDPKGILKASAQAIKSLNFVSYDATYEYVIGGPTVRREQGRVEIERGGVNDPILPGRIYIRANGNGGSQEVSFDGKTARRLEHDKKLLVEGTAERGGIRVALTSALTLLDWNFIWAEPLKFESAYTSAQYIGQASVGGVLCHVIDLQYSVPGTDISSGRWWFAVEDKLPRMFQKFEKMPDGNFIRELRITNLQINNRAVESKFKLELPEGYAYQSFIPTATKVKLIAAGENSPDWVLKDSSGKQWRLSDFRGKVVVLKFWTSSCGYCKLALPEIQKIHEKYKNKDVQVLGINVQEEKGVNPAAYLRSKGGDYLTLINGDKTATGYGVQGVPVFYIIDQEGKVAYATSGYNPGIGSQLEEAINRILSAKTVLKSP